jgi:peptidyl-dipeptidase A
MWLSWHDSVGTPMKADYVRMVDIANAARASWAMPIPAPCGARTMT